MQDWHTFAPGSVGAESVRYRGVGVVLVNHGTWKKTQARREREVETLLIGEKVLIGFQWISPFFSTPFGSDSHVVFVSAIRCCCSCFLCTSVASWLLELCLLDEQWSGSVWQKRRRQTLPTGSIFS